MKRLFPGCHVLAVSALLAAGCGGKRESEGKEPPTRSPSGSAEAPDQVGPPVEVSILYGSEKKTWLEEQIKAFNASRAKTKDGREIHVAGKPIGSGEATTAILDG